MTAPHQGPASSPVLPLLGFVLVAGLVGGAAWELKRGYDIGQLDDKRQSALLGTVGDIDLFRRDHGFLPRSLSDTQHLELPDVGPVGYRLIDAQHFQLGMHFAGRSDASQEALGSAWKHASGYSWFTFDARKMDDPAHQGVPDPDAVESAGD